MQPDLVVENPADHRADHHTGRPGGMHNVEVVGPVFREERRHQRIGHRLKNAVCQGEDKHTPEQEGVRRGRGRIGPRSEGNESGKNVAGESSDNELAVTDLVRDHTTNDDAEAESSETGTADQSQLATGESVFARPVVENTATDGKTYAGSQDGHKARPQQPHAIHFITHSETPTSVKLIQLP